MQNLKNNGSAALLGLLVVLLIGALLYMIDLSAIFGPVDKKAAYDERPWFEEKRLMPLPVKQTGKGGKTLILCETILTSPVTRKDTNRGNIEIAIEPNGLAKGHWQCSYEYPEDKSSYTITADFRGNIDPTKTYCDPNGYNKKLLYFITKGKYLQVKTDADKKQWPTEAPVYVVGWIDKDKSARGKIFLMSNDDPESHGNAEYDWKTK
ncbi:MAG: hypothetical protein LLF92_07450 [Planctomycetaceae bacterium]|nr:hypothetical protein [Planctomycetaceae bacterium]